MIEFTNAEIPCPYCMEDTNVQVMIDVDVSRGGTAVESILEDDIICENCGIHLTRDEVLEQIEDIKTSTDFS